MNVTGKKIYLQPKGTILNAISDLAEMQKGKLAFSDTPNGIIHFFVTMYREKWEYRFLVQDIGENRSIVELEVDGNDEKKESILNREYALLDAIMSDVASIE